MTQVGSIENPSDRMPDEILASEETEQVETAKEEAEAVLGTNVNVPANPLAEGQWSFLLRLFLICMLLLGVINWTQQQLLQQLMSQGHDDFLAASNGASPLPSLTHRTVTDTLAAESKVAVPPVAPSRATNEPEHVPSAGAVRRMFLQLLFRFVLSVAINLCDIMSWK